MKIIITDKALKSLKTKRDAFDAGVNAGIEHVLMNPPKTEPSWVNIGERFNVAGVQYGDYQLIVGGLRPGTVLQVFGEPNNPFDKKAIRLEYNKIKLGYIPRSAMAYPHTSVQDYCWTCHNSGYKVIAIVTAFNKENPTWDLITVQMRHSNRCPEKNPVSIKF